MDPYTPRFFIRPRINLNTKKSTTCSYLLEFLMFNTAFGRHRHCLPSIIILVVAKRLSTTLFPSSTLPVIGILHAGSNMRMMDDCVGFKQCRFLPKAELNTKNSTRWQLLIFCLDHVFVSWRPSWTRKTQPGGSSAALPGWVFGVQLDYSCREKLPAKRGKPCSAYVIPSVFTL